MNDLLARIIGFIVLTFCIAIIYGLFVTTLDFLNKPDYSPLASGHHAADKVYGLFGIVSAEVKRNEEDRSSQITSISHKVALPYAVAADLSAVMGGKLEIKISSLLHSTQPHT